MRATLIRSFRVLVGCPIGRRWRERQECYAARVPMSHEKTKFVSQTIAKADLAAFLRLPFAAVGNAAISNCYNSL
jgi:hypothetical protein